MVRGKLKLVSKIENRKRFNLFSTSNFHTIFKFLTTIFQFILDLIFPKYCFGCNKESSWLCEECLTNILPVETQTCPNCKKITQTGRYCSKCRKKASLSGVIVAAYYEEGPVKELIHNFKYNHILEVENILGDLMTQALRNNFPAKKDLLITCVPLHFLRQARRGYNQSEILANYIAGKLKISKNFKILKKIRKTRPQVQFSGKKRRENLKNSFKICKNADVLGKTFVVVDDVTTTGATLNECARILKVAGARRVWGLVIAKG